MKTEIEIEGIAIEVERKWIRSMRLTVKPPDGRVHLSMPIYCSMAEAERFLRERLEWIIKSREAVRARSEEWREKRQEKRYESGETHYLFGRAYVLEVQYIRSGSSGVQIEGDRLVMRCRAGSSRERREAILKEWYREQLTPVLDALIAQWLEKIGEGPVTWRIRDMRREWGSCTARKRSMLFNLKLARVPAECVEYVVVHELTHLAVQNHGPAFKKLMTERLPEWKTLRHKLNDTTY